MAMFMVCQQTILFHYVIKYLCILLSQRSAVEWDNSAPTVGSECFQNINIMMVPLRSLSLFVAQTYRSMFHTSLHEKAIDTITTNPKNLIFITRPYILCQPQLHGMTNHYTVRIIASFMLFCKAYNIPLARRCCPVLPFELRRSTVVFYYI